MSTVRHLSSTEPINFDIEALRGFAAIFVVWHHTKVYSKLLDSGFTPKGIFSYDPSGHFCVLIFFILSGYVIGISNKHPLTWSTSLLYLKKRLVRLYPIYLITLAFTILALPYFIDTVKIMGNLILLQGLVFEDINPPSWSLHYEMLYYSLFILISIFRVNPLFVAFFALLIGIINYILYPTLQTPIITSYCYGLIFWTIGLAISRYLGNKKSDKVSHQVLLSCIFFILCIDQYNIFATVMRGSLNISFPAGIFWDKIAVEAYDLAYSPFALAIILIFIGKQIPYKLLILKIILLSSIPKLLFVLIHTYIGDIDSKIYTIPTLFLIVSFIFLFTKNNLLEAISEKIIAAGIKLGALSYGIYLVHFPILVVLSRIKIYSGNQYSYLLRFGLLFIATIVMSQILEKYIQPKIKGFFFNKVSSQAKLQS